MKMSLSEMRNLETELNWCSVASSFYECRVKKATNDADRQLYSAMENYYDGRVDSYLSLSRMYGLNIEKYQEVHHKIEDCDFTATEYAIIQNNEEK